MKSVLEGIFPLFRRHDGFSNFWFAAFFGGPAAFLGVLAAFFPVPGLTTFCTPPNKKHKGIEARFIIYGEPLT